MSSVKPGAYTVELAFNTKSPIGILTSRRECIVESPMYDQLSGKYTEAVQKKNTQVMARTRTELLSKWFTRKVKPGNQVVVNKPLSSGVNAASKENTTIEWYPKADYLQIKANVVDPGFSTGAAEDNPQAGSCLMLYVSPSGTGADINQFIVIPKGDYGVAKVKASRTDKVLNIKANWKQTGKGYYVDVQIPWSIVAGYKKNWSVMPIEAVIYRKSSSGAIEQIVMNRPGSPESTARTYAVLTAK